MTTTESTLCGTVSGYERHLRERTTTCEPCKTARREYQREWRARGGVQVPTRTKAINVPKMLLAEMYLNSPIELQERIEKELGRRRIDTLVRLFDAQENA
ncbi:hypothetical protein [Rhodococcus sp. 5G237]